MRNALPFRPEILVPTALLAVVFVYLSVTTTPWVLDSDGYQRLNRVVQLLEDGGWYDAIYHRTNPPWGEATHWTRPLDSLLALAALPLLPFLPAKQALLLSSPFAILLQAWLATAAFVWAIRPLVSQETRVFAGLLFATQPVVLIRCFLPNQPDHHGLLILLFAVQLGTLLRLASGLATPRTILLGGIATGLSLWVSTETLAALGIFTGLAGLAWLWIGRPDLARGMALFWTGLAIALALALPIERPWTDLATMEFDRLALPHLAMAVAGGLGWSLLGRFSPQRIGSRLGLAAGFSGIAAAGLHLAFPGILGGPLADLDPAFAAAYDAVTPENQPILTLSRFDPVTAALALSLPVAALFVWWIRLRRNWVLSSLLPFMVLAASMARWTPYGEVTALAILMIGLDGWFAGRFRLAAVLAVAVGPLLAAGLAGAVAAENPGLRGCDLGPVLPVLNGMFADSPRTILADGNAPRLLFETPHRLVTIGFHRHAERIGRLWRALAAPDDGLLRKMVRDQGADLVLYCPVQANPVRLPGRPVVLDRPPAWLMPIQVPGTRPEGYRLFEVMRSGETADAPRSTTGGP